MAVAVIALVGCGSSPHAAAPAEPFVMEPPPPPPAAPVARELARPAEPAEVARAEPRERPTEPVDVPADGKYGAKHIVVMHVGSKRKPAHVQRSKAEARALIDSVLQQLEHNLADWDSVCAQYSDEPGAKHRAGDLGHFRKGMMVPEFEHAVERTRVGTLSGIVETEFGYHVILRTK